MTKNTLIDLQSIVEAVPFKVLVSMENQLERRKNALGQLKELSFDAEWKIPVKIENINWDPLPPIFRRAPRYASQALTIIGILHEALRRRAESFMHIEDDVTFHHDIRALLPQIMVPKDWRFIYLGGRSWGRKQYISRGLVRSKVIYDLHAVIIRTNIISSLERALLNPKIDSHWCDVRIASLQRKYPAYLCRPNLAWQTVHCDDSGTGADRSNYYEDGSVKPDQGN